MNSLSFQFFSGVTSELTALQSGSIDLTDSPCSPSLCASLQTNPNFYVTPATADNGFGDLEFHLGQNFWGCQLGLGGSACGVNIRQAFAHGLDKNGFVNIALSGAGTPADNPVPPSVTLNSPNPCGWDTSFPQTGSQCVVNAPGGTAYHLQSASIAGVSCHGNPGIPSFAWTPQCGTPDFCASAQHLIAAGIATGKDPSTCVLTGVSASASANAIQLFVRNDDPSLLSMGQSYAQFICALFTGAFTTGCSSFATVLPGPFTAFPGFSTSPTATQLSWWVYTGYNKAVTTPDQSLLFKYDSQFVSSNPSIQAPTGPCSAGATPSYHASNYLYLCNASYDGYVVQGASAPCLTAPGDPTSGQTTPTFANCPNTTQLTSASAYYQAQNTFGQNAFAIPVWSGNNQYAYLSNWRGIVNSASGFPNFFTLMNAYSPNPAITGTLRQGLEASDPLNPYLLVPGTVDWAIQSQVYDTLYKLTPFGQVLDWMAINHQLLSNSALPYIPPVGTVVSIRNTLRGDIFWHDGTPVTPYDVAFSFLSLLQAGAPISAGLASVTGITVYNPRQFDINLNFFGPFTLSSLAAVPIVPGRVWSQTCSGNAWLALAQGPQQGETVVYSTHTTYQPTLGDFVVAQFVGTTPPVAGSTETYDPHITFYDGNIAGPPWVTGTWSGTGGGSTTSAWTGKTQPVVYDGGDTPPGNFDPTQDIRLNFYDAPPYYLFNAGLHNLLNDPNLKFIGTGSYVPPGVVETSRSAFVEGSPCMVANPTFIAPTYDPAVQYTLIGSGPYLCQDGAGRIGGGCGTGFGVTLTRFGAGVAPCSSLKVYFGTNGNLACWVWSGMTGFTTKNDFVNFAQMATCYGKVVPTTGCTGWQEGIGNPSSSGAPVTISQVSIAIRFYGVNWVSPYLWAGVVGIGPYPPGPMFEGAYALNPGYLVGVGCFLAANGGGALVAYPGGGGYDC